MKYVDPTKKQMGSMTSHESSQKVSLMKAAVWSTRPASPPHSSRRTWSSAVWSMSAFWASMAFSSSLAGSFSATGSARVMGMAFSIALTTCNCDIGQFTWLLFFSREIHQRVMLTGEHYIYEDQTRCKWLNFKTSAKCF